MKKKFWMGSILGVILNLHAQVPDSDVSPMPAKTESSTQTTRKNSGGSSGSQKESSVLGKDIPLLNPGNEILSWDGKNWNINQNRLFQARFEKYLNAPEETSKEDKEYQKIIREIMDKLSPNKANARNLDEAWALLPKASGFDMDAHLCVTLADAILSFWNAKREQTRLDAAAEALEEEKKLQEWTAQTKADNSNLSPSTSSNKDTIKEQIKRDQLKSDLTIGPILERIAELKTKTVATKTKSALMEVQAKIEFQTLIVNFFLQRRFQHVLIATRFYRHLNGDGDTTLKVDGETKDLFAKNTGMPPTVGTLDSMANELIRDVKEGIDAFLFLLQKNELESATKRLQEAFVIGEYMPELRTLPRDQKRQALAFSQKSYQLISALEVKDYTLAENLVKELKEIAKDFDESKPVAAIETAKVEGNMHLLKAKNAAIGNDTQTFETEIKEAAQIWPRNPELAKLSSLVFSKADVQQKALVDFDQLMSQRNYRQIYDDKVRYIVAVSAYPERQTQLTKVLDDIQTIEVAIMRSNEIAKQGSYAGAWENIERVFKQFPDDNKLNQLRATLTTKASQFVHTLETAQDLEKKQQIGSSLAWYLKAQKIYPPSEFAKEGIDRLIKKIMPDV